MKERKIIITIAVIIGVLMLGIAYAAITTQTLNITGNVTTSLSDTNLDVRFKEFHDYGTYGGLFEGYVDPNDPTGRTAVFNLVWETGEYQAIEECYLTVVNNGQTYAKISNIEYENPNTKWYDVGFDFEGDVVLAPGEEVDVFIYIELLHSVTNEEEKEEAKCAITFTFDAEAVENPDRETT